MADETLPVDENTRYIVACTTDQDFLPTWDGQLFERPNDPVARADLSQLREQLAQTHRLRARTGQPGPEHWGVFALVRVPDETVFGAGGE